jgi:ABC-type transport system involved in cytochrome c biogenesis permease subunit
MCNDNIYSAFVYCTLIFYLLAALIYFSAARLKSLAWIAPVLALAGFLTNTLALVARTMLVGRLPLANGAEFLLCFSWLPFWPIFFIERKSKNTTPAVWQR